MMSKVMSLLVYDGVSEHNLHCIMRIFTDHSQSWTERTYFSFKITQEVTTTQEDKHSLTTGSSLLPAFKTYVLI